ncbi:MULTISPECIES: pyridoxal phosphate-dependent aminotransferase [unclassified Sedimentibacter]|uniref:pyridoxal phosphate-dependent aminotransferase n=1 Tax=unclassified Sedimentibacter TaxID=2649220 RepID=UPI0027E1CD98|nr:pyridoxal phosphate-dependent aminotransferase [Sedimentibacter sp. MB35-C1]WMJ77737.1 pyridoxal phosphate-dependent aminotransferase [Sedimentibacter sp. MB35-C1]
MEIKAANRTEELQPSIIREVLNRVQKLKKQGKNIIDFSIGRPNFDTPEHIKEAAKKALDEGKVHYTATPGSMEFREAVCSRLYEDFKIEAQPEQVIETIGATEAIVAALQGILNPGDEVLVPTPSYVYYDGWIHLTGAKSVHVPLTISDNFSLSADKLEEYITEKTKCIILNTPNNPTGIIIDSENIKKIADIAIKYNLIVISDDIYNGITYDNISYDPIANLPNMLERTIIIGSFSKTYAMDGWRVGYLVVPKTLISGILKIHQHTISCPNTFVEAGSIAALTGSQNCVKEMVKEFERRRNLIMKNLDEMNIEYVKPKGAFYIFPSIKKYGLSSSEAAMYLLEKAGVAVVPGSAFGDTGEGYIRISFATSYEDIELGMKKIKEALDGLSK